MNSQQRKVTTKSRLEVTGNSWPKRLQIQIRSILLRLPAACGCAAPPTGPTPAAALGARTALRETGSPTPAPAAGRGALFMSAWNTKSAVAEKIHGDFISNEWLRRATHFWTAVVVKRELATNLLSALPGWDAEIERWLSARLPRLRSEPAQCMKESHKP